MDWEGLALERKREEAVMENMAQAHADNGERECDECGEWTDEYDMAVYRDQQLCPDCHREYVLADFEELVKEIKTAFGGKTAAMAENLLAAIKEAV
jgi:NAD-dependent SIR2 family protein deacetylase